MNEKPTIYGHCDAGCKWEVPHKSDLNRISAFVRVKKDAIGRHFLAYRKTYKILGGLADWGFSIKISWRMYYAAAHTAYATMIQLPEFDCSDGILFTLWSIDTKGEVVGEQNGIDRRRIRLVYEIDGVIHTHDVPEEDCPAVPASGVTFPNIAIEVIGAEDCLLVNTDVQNIAEFLPATTETAGGVIVGDTLTIDGNGVLDVKDDANGKMCYSAEVDSWADLIAANVIIPQAGDVFRVKTGGTVVNGVPLCDGGVLVFLGGEHAVHDNWRVLSNPEAITPNQCKNGQVIISADKTRYHCYSPDGFYFGTKEKQNIKQGYAAFVHLQSDGKNNLMFNNADVLEGTSLNGATVADLVTGFTNAYIIVLRGSKDLFDWFFLGKN
jgi:hypothetical protein